MKQLTLTILFALVYSLNYGQSQKKEVDSLQKLPIIFIDSVLTTIEDMKRYNPDDIASVTVYKDSTKFKHLDSKADGAIYIETNQFSRKRFLNYFKSKSPKFKNLLASKQSDDSFQYILNGEVLSKNYEGKLAAIDDKNFKSITIIRKNELVKKYGETNKTFGIVIVSEVPENTPGVKK